MPKRSSLSTVGLDAASMQETNQLLAGAGDGTRTHEILLGKEMQ